MTSQGTLSYSHSAEYRYIEYALQSRWDPFVSLEMEFLEFRPRSISEFGAERAARLAHLKKLNPNTADERLLEDIDGQIAYFAQPVMQVAMKFNDRIMSDLVTVAFLSHSLCEAVVNAVLAVGLSLRGTPELFALVERADIKEKWLTAPRALDSRYELKKSTSLYETLQHLTKQRNALVHYKIDLEVSGKNSLRGSEIDPAPLKTQLIWMRRYFSLPYDLAAHARKMIDMQAVPVIHNSGPIKRFRQHADA
jgi:hypothetical protein